MGTALSGERLGVRWALLAALAAATACVSDPGVEQDPKPTAVEPSRGVSTGEVPVVIVGADFQPLAVRQVGGSDPAQIRGGFSAWLGQTALLQVTRRDSEHLDAVVPAGLADGWYDLRVRSPLGREATLPHAYFASSQRFADLKVTASLAAPSVAVGGTVALDVAVENLGEADALGVAAAVAQTGAGSVSIGAAPAAQDVPGGQTRHFSFALTGATRGAVALAPSAAGTDTLSDSTIQASGDPLGLTVLGAPGLTGAASVAPARVSVGQEIAVALTVSNPGEVAVSQVQAQASLSGAGHATLVASPAPADVAAGGSADLSWRFAAAAPGTVSFEVSAQGKDGLSGAAVTYGPASAGTCEIQSAAALSATVTGPPAVSVGQVFEISAEVANAGQAGAVDVTGALSLSGTASATIVGVPAAQVVPGGASRTFVFQVRADGPGLLQGSFSATGADANSGAAAATGPVACPDVLVQQPAALAAVATLAPAVAGLGQQLDFHLEVTNSGEADALDVTPSAPVPSGTGAATLLTSPLPARIPGGSVHVFAWTYTAAATRDLALTSSAQGLDANSLLSVATAPATSATIQIAGSAELSASLASSRNTANPGQALTLTLTVQNFGGSTATSVHPSPMFLSGTGAATLVDGPLPATADLAPGALQAFVWHYTAASQGDVRFEAAATGNDSLTGGAVNSAPASTTVQIQLPATLAAALSAPATAALGKSFAVTMTLTNSGGADAVSVTPSALSMAGPGVASVLSGPTPASLTVPAGGTRSFTWQVAGSGAGSLGLSTSASGTDWMTGATVDAPAASATVLLQRPAALGATLTVPLAVGLGTTFTATLHVDNTGDATALAVTPGALTASGTGAVSLVSGPSPATADVAGGNGQDFTWTWSADSLGTFTLTGSASGTDANDATALSTGPVVSNLGTIQDVEVLPAGFGDATSFAFVFGFAGKVYLGPDHSGSGAVRFDPDGSAQESVSLLFFQDSSGSNVNLNTWAGQTCDTTSVCYTSLGTQACIANTAACGPDNESQRGLFTSGSVAGTPWLAMSGARPLSTLRHIYLTSDTGLAPLIRYVDLSTVAGANAITVSSMHFLGGRLYVGLFRALWTGPLLLELGTLPPKPGLDAVAGTDVVDLGAPTMPGINVGQPITVPQRMIDSMTDFGGLLYVANNGGVMRATVARPGPYGTSPGDWASATPAAAEWGAQTSQTSLKSGNLVPSDKAVPAMAAWGGRLYLARNTNAGPQWFACDPAATAPLADCDPGDWSLFVPNTVGDPTLCQFDDPANASVALLLSTPSHLYVGFENPNGLVLYRTSSAAPAGRADFTPVGAPGLGVGATHIFDSTALTFSGADYLYLTVGDGTGPVRVVRVGD